MCSRVGGRSGKATDKVPALVPASSNRAKNCKLRRPGAIEIVLLLRDTPPSIRKHAVPRSFTLRLQRAADIEWFQLLCFRLQYRYLSSYTIEQIVDKYRDYVHTISTRKNNNVNNCVIISLCKLAFYATCSEFCRSKNYFKLIETNF